MVVFVETLGIGTNSSITSSSADVREAHCHMHARTCMRFPSLHLVPTIPPISRLATGSQASGVVSEMDGLLDWLSAVETPQAQPQPEEPSLESPPPIPSPVSEHAVTFGPSVTAHVTPRRHTGVHAATTQHMQVANALAGITTEHNTHLLYKDHITEPVQHVRKLRGEQMREFTIMEFCSGAAPSSMINPVTGLFVRTLFTCDSEAAAWRWVEANGPHEIQAHFTDMREVAKNLKISSDRYKPEIKIVKLEGFCALRGEKHTMYVEAGTVDCMISGLSCKPFSCARSKRFSQGSSVHQDADLWRSCRSCEHYSSSSPLSRMCTGSCCPSQNKSSRRHWNGFWERCLPHARPIIQFVS